MKFKTPFDPVEVSPSCPGSELSNVCELVYKNGEPHIHVVKQINVKDMINSYADSCDMSIILNKLASGLISPEFSEDDCADISDIPNNFADAIEVVKTGRNILDELSTIVDNNVDNVVDDDDVSNIVDDVKDSTNEE